MYYTQIRANAIAGALTGGLDGIVDLHGDARADRISDLPDGPCLPVPFDPRTLPLVAAAGAQHHHPGRPSATFYKQQFAQLRPELRPAAELPRQFVNPRSQVTSIGAEREIMHGLVRRRRLRASALDRPRSHASI